MQKIELKIKQKNTAVIMWLRRKRYGKKLFRTSILHTNKIYGMQPPIGFIP